MERDHFFTYLYRELRKDATIECPKSSYNNTEPCNPLETPCLFNVVTDPCERENLAKK